MAIDSLPRSVEDATRFTSCTPYARAKAGSYSASMHYPAAARARGGGGSGAAPESLDERVRRLRAAHLAARNHSVSRMDRVINVTRRYMDVAHRVTVLGLIGFSALALVVTVYATVDMMVYNRKRRAEFFAVQQKLEADSLEAARLAYMQGKASDEQIALVDEANARAKQSGISLPSLLSAPQPAAPAGGRTTGSESASEAGTAWTGNTMQGTSSTMDSDLGEGGEPKKRGLRDWLFGGLKKEDPTAEADGLGAGPGEAPVRDRAVTDIAGDVAGTVKAKATAAFEAEREKQRRGGPLDLVGTTEQTEGAKKDVVGSQGEAEVKKGWW